MNIEVLRIVFWLLFLAIFLVTTLKLQSLRLKLLAYSVLALGYCILNRPYSPIDEGAHFDYVNAIATTKTIPKISSQMNSTELATVSKSNVPSGIRYEAYHPPLYYLLSAALTGQVTDLTIRFYLLRLLGVAGFVISILFLHKSYRLLTCEGYLPENENLFWTIALFTAINPGVVTRIVTVSNEQLLIPLSTILIYCFLKQLVRAEKSWKSILLITALSTCLVLTKLTAVIVVGVIFLSLLYMKQFRNAGIYTAFLSVGLLPWLLFNYSQYGSFTGSQEHLGFVKPIVNPQNLQLDLPYIARQIWMVPVSFFYPQECSTTFPATSYFLSIFSALAGFSILAYLLSYALYMLKHRTTALSPLFVVSGFLAANLAFICYGTVSYDISLLIGRYFYLNLLAVVVAFLWFVNAVFQSRHSKSMVYFLIFVSAGLHGDYVSGIFKRHEVKIQEILAGDGSRVQKQ